MKTILTAVTLLFPVLLVGCTDVKTIREETAFYLEEKELCADLERWCGGQFKWYTVYQGCAFYGGAGGRLDLQRLRDMRSAVQFARAPFLRWSLKEE